MHGHRNLKLTSTVCCAMQSAAHTGSETRMTREWTHQMYKCTFELCSSQTVKLNIMMCLNCTDPKQFHYCITVTKRSQHTVILLSGCDWRSESDRHFSRNSMLGIILEWGANKWNFICARAKFLSYFRLSLLMCVIVVVSCFILLIFKRIKQQWQNTVLVTYSLGPKRKQLLLGVLVESVHAVNL